MDKKLNEWKQEYQSVPIPDELNQVVDHALKQPKKRFLASKTFKGFIGFAAAIILFVVTVNTNTTFAQSLVKVPILGSIVKVVTFSEIIVTDENHDAHIQTPKINGLEDKQLADSLNQKYMQKSKKLYDDFMKKTSIEKNGHYSISSGYDVKVNDSHILSIGSYVEEIQASSYTTIDYDTIDKQKKILLTLPILFKNNSYIDTISENIKDQMLQQMKQDPNKIYWVKGTETKDMDFMEDDLFTQIEPDQTFYINKDHQLVIVFDQYEAAPGYMGVTEFIIPTEVIASELAGDKYISG